MSTPPNDIHPVIIIGSGPAGLTAAIYTARASLTPLVIEGEPSSTSDQPGGQLMLTTEVENFPGFPEGVMGPELMGNFRAQAERFGAEFITEKVTRVDFSERPFRVWIGDDEHRAQSVIVSTGARSLMLGLEAEQRLIGHGLSTCATCDGFFFRDKEIVVVGGGPFAVESAQALNRLGVQVTLFETLQRLLSRDEPELADRLALVLRREGVDLRLGTAVTGLRSNSAGVTVETADGETEAAAVLLATGRTANAESLGLDRLGIAAGPDGISVDARSRTIVSSIYAVGDVAAGRSLFTPSAAHDAVMAVRDMFLPGRGSAATLVPWVTFTDPQLAHVGMTAAEARERFGDRRVRVSRFDLAETDRARIDSTPDGMVTVVTARGKVVGGHILAPEAGEMIQELALAVRFSMSIRELGEIAHVYPTMSTGISQMVAEDVFARIRRVRRLAKLSRLMG